MPNLDTLDTVIAIIVVLLVLSLIVQAIQSFIKKVFKLKSREIEKSLADLFEHVIDKTSIEPLDADAATPAGGGPQSGQTTNAARQLADTVLGEFQKVGRYTKRGRVVLDSISKEDLLKILARVDSKHFYADYVTKFQAMYADIEALEGEINRLVTNDPPLLQGVASARFAEMREVLSPLINDVKNIVSGSAVKPDVLFGDLINLRRVKLNDALQLLAAAQEAIAADIKAEREAGNKATVAVLQQLSTSLSNIAGIVGQLSQRMDAAFASLRVKLDHVEVWYDTVMQSFEERYTRQMKSVALYISIVVVVFLNASFFRIYRSIATNDLQRALIVQQGQELTDNSQRSGGVGNPVTTANNAGNSQVNANGNTSNTSNTNNTNNTNNTAAPGNTNADSETGARPTAATAAQSSASSQPSTSSTTADEPAVTVKELEEQREVIEGYVEKYEGFGFSPLTWQQIKTWTSRFVNPPSGQWWSDRRQDFSTLLGWTLMVLLLSVGAPFWQDTLESLFGVKNLLRKKSETRNVEKESGAGQPRQ